MSKHPPANGTAAYRINRLEQELHETRMEMDRRFDQVDAKLEKARVETAARFDRTDSGMRRVYWSFVTVLITIAAAGFVYAATVSSGGGP